MQLQEASRPATSTGSSLIDCTWLLLIFHLLPRYRREGNFIYLFSTLIIIHLIYINLANILLYRVWQFLFRYYEKSLNHLKFLCGGRKP